ncbi:MAG: glycoside hydrolase family 3 C-terminal domain-containing protein [Muribaculaceae bacterium]|nr:glycoside hydrolase family 3 C-terminal domain-containing protein [Muribaculaceae bacterium]MCF0214635.1 glycoside hydrolase family 3 C-terminal domain-containing protein [Muribaculaceae bacterium]MCF0214744.1 glycoside hydrolase family 3 C-terminal domain-containing protein [Muribaculaceae bacterium]
MKSIKTITSALLAAAALAFVGNVKAAVPVYLDDTKPLEERVEDALSRMTLEEKVAILHAQSKFSAPGVPRLGIPELWCTDGPMGVRPEVLWDEWEQASWTNDSCTAFPSLTCLAATWNPDMARLYGKSIGAEARFRNKSVLLGPGINIYRTPLCGRNFEYMGEDPYLIGKMATEYVKGVQDDNGVSVCVKHFALNNNEINRHTSNPIVDDRTLYEIYLPGYKAAALDGGAWSFMGGYNLFRGTHASYNPILMNQILKGEWGWDGAVISDWGAVHDTESAVNGGLDMEFGSWTDGLANGASNAYDNYWMANPYLKGLREGKYSEDVLNDKVRRVLRLTFRTAMNRNRPWGAMGSDDHIEACRKIGQEGIVLLQNRNNVLPVDPARTPRIAVIGENAIKMMTVGGGSSSLKARYEVTPLDGLKARLGDKAQLTYARGYVGDTTGEYNGVVTGQNLEDPRSEAELTKEAVDVARNADVVIFIGGLNKSNNQDCEDTDRKDMSLPYNQDALIQALAKANPNLVVVNISGTGVAMPWADKVAGIVQAWYLGNETGNTLASVLLGDVNPSGKLPYTYYASLDQCGAHALGEYPGTPGIDALGNEVMDMPYNEGIYVGYRYIDRNKLRPTFPFGHGLSYTTFKYGNAKVDKDKIAKGETVKVTVPVTNTGKRAGAEIVQLYISDAKSSVDRPVKELKGFRKVYLQPGETADVEFVIGEDALSFFDAASHSWVAEPGRFEALIGASSADIRTKVPFDLK